MQAVPPIQQNRSNIGRNLGYLLMVPFMTVVIGMLLFAIAVVSYQSRHTDKIYTGVYVENVDLSRMTLAEAEVALVEQLGNPNGGIVLTDPVTGQSWSLTHDALGMSVDWATMVDEAFDVGRTGGNVSQLQEMFQVWYYGRSIPPTYIFDEGKLITAVNQLANEINQPALNAQMIIDGDDVQYLSGQTGRALDSSHLEAQIRTPLLAFQSAEIELLIHDVRPSLVDAEAVAYEVDRIFASPASFYLQEPLDELDLDTVALSPDELVQWIRVEVVSGNAGGYEHNVFIDEVAMAQWLSQYEDELYRDPVNARFYFDDNTRELILVAPHINGRELDIPATIALFQDQIKTSNRSIPFVMREIMPTAHQDVTAVELGITELVTETTTWFRGSTAERKHNIARAAANFFGVVIAPGEEFSFNKYLGSISEGEGYEQGFVIIGGQAVEGIGGGVCQVSTTLYQTAFNAGFPITERWPHGYMLGYYNDGEGPGMDATIFSPIVDMKFINNTPHHLLIENYYSTENEALTFKFYSTSMGRQIVKEALPWENIVPAPPQSEDRWEYNPELEEGEVVQIDWATEGADVSVRRTIYNEDGQLIGDQIFTSNYIPIGNVFQYGPGVEPFDYSKVPDYNN